MSTMCPPAGVPGGSPFANRYERAMWEASYPVEFETREELEAAIAEIQDRPEFRGVTISVTEA